MKKLMTILMMIVFAFVVSCGADNPAGDDSAQTDLTETADAKAFADLVKGKQAINSTGGMGGGSITYVFTDKKVAFGGLNFDLVEALSTTKALYTGKMGPGDVYIVLEVTGGDTLNSTPVIGPTVTTREYALAATSVKVGTLTDTE